MVNYGTNIESLPFYGEYLSSGMDIGAVDKMYSVQLKGLSPGTKYCFIVAVNNSYNSSKTVPSCFHTKETGDTQSKVFLLHFDIALINQSQVKSHSLRLQE